MADQLSPTGRFERILLATDGSDFCTGAERVAIAMCVKSGASLTITTSVISSPEFDTHGASEAQDQREAEASAHLDRLEAQATSLGIATTKVIRYGDDPYKDILAEAEHVKADLIVVGRRGRRGLARLMLGDATLKVISMAKCNVMVVPKACDMWKSRLLLATDGSRSSDAAAVATSRIAHCCAVPVSVLSVEVPGHSAERQAQARPIVSRVVTLLKQEGVEAEALVEKGETHHAILDVARQKGADLIVMGSHGRTSLGRLLLGSNSERVIGRTTCPVLVVKG
ncbi:MAG: universal stress protein [Alphaproteobacteria bacterium]|nr:universal stress protein [Alphaproteobacteria bacterium]